MRRAWVLAFLAAACSSTEPAHHTSKPPADKPAACQVSLVADAAHDLALRGKGACPATVDLSLRVATGDAASPTWNPAASAPLRVAGSWRAVEGGFARDLTVENPGTAPVTLVGLEWATDELSLPFDRSLHDGYQSWSYTGVEPLAASLAEDRGTAAHGGEEDPLGEAAGVSWWWTAIAAASGEGLVAGAEGATVLKTFLAADTGRLRVVQGMASTGIVLGPGEKRSLDGLFVALGDVTAGLDAYAAHVAEAHPPPSPRSALGGWGSWNLYYAEPTASLIEDEAAWAAQTLAPLGLTDLLLDDGYEPHWGAWTAKPSFGSELPALNATLAAEGLRPALWLAPFFVDVADPMTTDHDAWFVHDPGGALHTFTNLGGPTYATLDVTVPEARDFLTGALTSLKAAGYRTLKLDFLFAGAAEGVRSQPLTGLEAYALGMKTIRAAVPDLHLVGCGAPMLPSVGWFDSMRIGADIAFAPTPTPEYRFGAAEARHVALRSFTDAFWALDPDVLLLRGDGISDAEAWTTTIATALAGGNYLLGDGRQANAARLAMALDPTVLSLARDGRAARPLDLVKRTDPKILASPILDFGGETELPHVWRKTTAKGARVTAVFAWNDPDFSATVELGKGAEELLPPSGSSGVTTKPAGGTTRVPVPLHGVRVFRE